MPYTNVAICGDNYRHHLDKNGQQAASCTSRVPKNVNTFGEDGQDGIDWRIAICFGLGMKQNETADALGVIRQTVAAHIEENQQFFDLIIPFVKALDTSRASKNVSLVAEKAETRIKRMFDRSFRITERLIEKAEKLGDDITIKEAMEIHDKITVWSSKFAASEAPKRFDGTTTHTEIHKLDDDTITRLDSFMSKHSRFFGPQTAEIKGEVIDAQVISE